MAKTAFAKRLDQLEAAVRALNSQVRTPRGMDDRRLPCWLFALPDHLADTHEGFAGTAGQGTGVRGRAASDAC
jgi:hypothetical protein